MAEIPLFASPFVDVQRQGRHLISRLLAPARVLSTCQVNGGLREDISMLVNHQSCEPVKHQARFEFIVGLGQEAYHKHVCEELALDPKLTSLMGTAAAMQYLGIVTHAYADLSVTAIVTAGVTGNAGCAGDPATYDENNGAWAKTTPLPDKPAGTHSGTINTLLFFSSPLSVAALTRAAMTMTEAKTSALQELAIGSKSSWRQATGTGTDQFAIACPKDGGFERTWTGKHTKAGELIGLAVRQATLEALRWQNGLEASYTRSLLHALGRFGLSEERLKGSMEKKLGAEDLRLLKDNWNPVIYEPQLAAAAYAFATVLERILCGTLGASSARESLLNQAALMSCGLAAKTEEFPAFRARLISEFPAFAEENNQARIAASIELALSAIALGWSLKWKRD